MEKKNHKEDARKEFIDKTLVENARRTHLISFYTHLSEKVADEKEKAAKFRMKADELQSNIDFDTEFMNFLDK